MCQRPRFHLRPGDKKQLEAEEKWLEQALKMIRKQRSLLELERVKLEKEKLQWEKLLRRSGLSDGEESASQGPSEKSDPTEPQQHDLSGPMTSAMSAMLTQSCADEAKGADQELNLDPEVAGPSSSVPRPASAEHDSQSDDDTSSEASEGDNVDSDNNED